MARQLLTPVACLLVAAPLAAAGRPTLAPSQLQSLRSQTSLRAAQAMQQLLARRTTLGLGADDALQLKGTSLDAFGMTHARVRQTYRGVPVWGGDAVLHVDAEGQILAPTSKLVPGLDLAVEPALPASEALAIASRDMAPKAAFSTQPSPELVVLPRLVRSLRPGVTAATANASDVVTTTAGADLAWHLHLDVQSAADNRSVDYLVSATTGAVLKRWDSRETVGETPVTGTGNSQYSGSVSITTNQLSASSYEMRDPNRGATALAGFGSSIGSVVTDMANGTAGNGTLYTDADNTWGDGNNYQDGVTGGGTSGTTGQTAAVDAKYGFEATWDYYKNVHGRNGIDGGGKSTTLRMHYASNYDNAFWDDGCFCMTFGDGSGSASGGLNNLTAIDVIGHELSHGFCSNTAGLNYYDESGGLNEADSDINGTFITYYGYNGGTGSTVPNTIPAGNLHGYTPWTIGSQLANPPLRNMIKPSLDGQSADAWYFGVGNLNVHFSSGPMNRAMYFLAQGASSSSSALSYTSYLPSGMTGIGNDSASKIWFRAMTTYMTSSSTYHDARLACISAAIDLFGGTATSPSTEVAAVQNAFHGINVGPVAGQADDTQAPTGVTVSESGTQGSITFTASATDNVGVTDVDFAVDGTVVIQKAGTGSIAFDSHLLSNGTHSLVATAYDDYHNGASSSAVSFSILNSYSQFLKEPGFEQGGANWSFGGYAGASSSATYAHSGTYYAIVGGAGNTGNSYAYQLFTIPADAPNANLTLWTRISNTSYPTTDTTDSLKVDVYNSSLNSLLATLGTVTGKNATGSSVGGASWVKIGPFDMSSFKGQTIALVLYSTCTAGKTTFRVDDLSLISQYAKVDENGDGKVDGLDLGAFAQGYGTDPLSDFNNDDAT
ncbi:MAG TPA: M4 family metallopeptidase, partial [Holophagaceae bacterium]|nr:M4 family metallopeptidase [Holophagaceae bacterium]